MYMLYGLCINTWVIGRIMGAEVKESYGEWEREGGGGGKGGRGEGEGVGGWKDEKE